MTLRDLTQSQFPLDITVLVVDDEESALIRHEEIVSQFCRTTKTANRVNEAQEYLQRESYPVIILLDLFLSPGDHQISEDFVSWLRDTGRLDDGRCGVILTSQFADIHSALRMLKLGVNDYIQKNIKTNDLAIKLWMVDRIMRERQREAKLNSPLPHGIVSLSQQVIHAFRRAHHIATENGPILIVGEPGTGKMTLVRTIHEISGLNGNLRKVRGNLFEDLCILFKEVDNGTLYLDDITQLSMKDQVKLNTLIEEGINPFCDNEYTHTRIIASLPRDPKKMIDEGRIDGDLYFNMTQYYGEIYLPPLRERLEDILIISNSIINQYSNRRRELSLKMHLNKEAQDFLTEKSHQWQGNIRALKTVINQACQIASEDKRSIIFCKDFFQTSFFKKNYSSIKDHPTFTIQNQKETIFLSYSNHDTVADKVIDCLKKQLNIIQPSIALKFWSDKDIEASTDWEKEINHRLLSSKIGILLISPDFFNSDFIMEKEFPIMLEAWKKKHLNIFWFLLSDCSWEFTHISKIASPFKPVIPLDSINSSELNSFLKEAAIKIIHSYKNN